MKKRLLGFTLFWIACMGSVFGQVTGKVIILGQEDHSGIKVKFIAQSPTAKTDSTTTLSNGSYSINISSGLYKIQFSKESYQSVYYKNSMGQSLLVTTPSILDTTYLFSNKYIFTSGNLNGQLSKDSVYIFTKDVTVQEGETLTIQPGTQLYFYENIKLNLKGKLIAKGLKGDSILFSSYETLFKKKDAVTWSGFFFNALDTLILDYCKIESMFSDGVGFRGSVKITNSSISNSLSVYALLTEEQSAEFSNCIFKNCDQLGCITWDEKGKSCSFKCNKVVYYGEELNSSITGRVARLYTLGSKENFFENNIFDFQGYDNSINSWGGFYTKNGNGFLKFKNNLMLNYKNVYFTIGESDHFGNAYYENNTFHGGTLTIPFGSQYVVNNPILLKNNIFKTDLNLYFLYHFNQNVEASYNIFYGSTSGLRDKLGFGQKITTNNNGDLVDTYYNLFQDPEFLNGKPPFLAVGSPAINAGINQQGQPINIGFDPTGTCLEGYFVREPEVVSPDTLSISGLVHQGAGYLQDGVVMAINKTNNKTKITRIKAGGIFKADSLSKGDYILYAVPNPNSVSNYVPTFYINTVSMSQAITMPLEWKIIDVDIYLASKTTTSAGTAKINGRFSYADSNTDDTSATYSKNWFGVSYAPSGPIAIQGNPCKTLPVQLYNSSNKLIQWALTDTDGYFKFQNLTGGNYKVMGQRLGYITENEGLVELAQTETKDFNFRLTRSLATELDDDNIGNNSITTAYPNPFKDELFISGFKGNVRVTDLTGSVYYSNAFFTQQTISTSDWPKGIYLVKTGDKVHKVLKY